MENVITIHLNEGINDCFVYIRNVQNYVYFLVGIRDYYGNNVKNNFVYIRDKVRFIFLD